MPRDQPGKPSGSAHMDRFPGLPPGAIKPQVAHRLRVRVDAQPGGIAIAGGQLSPAGKRVKAGEPQGVVGAQAVGEGAAKHRGDAVGPHVAKPGPVQARQAAEHAQIGAAHQDELASRG